MLKRRLIPKLLIHRRRVGETEKLSVVTTLRFGDLRNVGDPVSQAKIYEAQSADELLFINIDGSFSDNRERIRELLQRVSREIFMPFTVGGGVTNIADFRFLLKHGADKVSINTAAVQFPSFISEAADAFGKQCIVLSIDFRKMTDGQFVVFSNNGQHQTSWSLCDWAKEGERRGAGEILLTSIDLDGTGSGLEIEAVRQVTRAVSVPVIASGGCGTAQHFIDGFLEGGASAVAAGTFFAFKDQNPVQTRSHVKSAGIPIRIHL